MNHVDLDNLLDGTQPCAAEPELFFPREGEANRPAQRICAGCPFLYPCRAYALTHREHGVWGGLTENQRAYERMRLGITAADPPPIKPRNTRTTGRAA
jgi:hypothetical protein